MKKFLTPLAMLVASFSANQAVAIQIPSAEGQSQVDSASSATKEMHSFVKNDNEFNFVLKRNIDSGLMMAYHESHASHASHSSHYSSR